LVALKEGSGRLPMGMKHEEFYSKYKASGTPAVDLIFIKRNRWHIVLITIVVVLIGPLIMYRHYRGVPFSLDYYLRVIGYLLCIYVPLIAFLFWSSHQESIKRKRGYSWVGKFEVMAKQTSFVFCYFVLAPGSDHKIKVSRSLFDKIRVGDFIMIRRDALGKIEEVSRVNNLSARLSRARRFPKPTKKRWVID
jgi:hypothetical protein